MSKFCGAVRLDDGHFAILKEAMNAELGPGVMQQIGDDRIRNLFADQVEVDAKREFSEESDNVDIQVPVDWIPHETTRAGIITLKKYIYPIPNSRYSPLTRRETMH